MATIRHTGGIKFVSVAVEIKAENGDKPILILRLFTLPYDGT